MAFKPKQLASGLPHMEKSIGILGCGWLGKALAGRLLDQGYRVKGSTRTESKLIELKDLNLEVYLIDLEDDTTLPSHFLACEKLVLALPLKNPEAFARLASQLERKSIKHIIYTSSTSVYPLENKLVNEESPVKNNALTETENILLALKKIPATILRLGGLVGYDRQPGQFFKENQPIPNPKGYINMLHRDDAVRAIELLLKAEPAHGIYNLCSPHHPARKAFYHQAFADAQRPAPSFSQDSNNYKIVSSEKFRNTFNFEFTFKNWSEVNLSKFEL